MPRTRERCPPSVQRAKHFEEIRGRASNRFTSDRRFSSNARYAPGQRSTCSCREADTFPRPRECAARLRSRCRATRSTNQDRGARRTSAASVALGPDRPKPPWPTHPWVRPVHETRRKLSSTAPGDRFQWQATRLGPFQPPRRGPGK